MLIRTQNKKEVVNALHVYISNELGSKRKHIFATYAGKTLFHDNTTSIAVYPTDETATEVIDEMVEFF
ncbi:MAG: hypothetical protein U1D64_03950, partial [Bacteroidales bacterium]|nr:hypothetical protein [Bacteroidales bacterium]